MLTWFWDIEIHKLIIIPLELLMLGQKGDPPQSFNDLSDISVFRSDVCSKKSLSAHKGIYNRRFGFIPIY